MKFGSNYSRKLRRNHSGFGDAYYLGEVFVRIGGKQHYQWRAVDQDSEVVDVFLQKRRNGQVVKRFFARLFKTQGRTPPKNVTDKLGGYGIANCELSPDGIHDTTKYANNRSGLSHQPIKVRARVMRRFKSIDQAQRFLEAHVSVYNLFNLGRDLITASHYRNLRINTFDKWIRAVI